MESFPVNRKASGYFDIGTQATDLHNLLFDLEYADAALSQLSIVPSFRSLLTKRCNDVEDRLI